MDLHVASIWRETSDLMARLEDTWHILGGSPYTWLNLLLPPERKFLGKSKDDCRPEGVIRRGFTRAFHEGIKLPEIPKNDLISGITVNSLNTFVPEGVQKTNHRSSVTAHRPSGGMAIGLIGRGLSQRQVAKGE